MLLFNHKSFKVSNVILTSEYICVVDLWVMYFAGNKGERKNLHFLVLIWNGMSVMFDVWCRCRLHSANDGENKQRVVNVENKLMSL